MIFRRFLLASVGLVALGLFPVGRVEGIRLCGRRLADLLNFICERNGGFHAPRMRRDALPHPSRRGALLEIFRPKSRRTAQETSTSTPTEVESAAGIFNSGVVDECCKNQCTLSTLVSYCADSREVSDINLDGVLFPGGSTLSNEDLEYLLQKDQAASTSNSSSEQLSGQQISYQDSESQSNRPNLGVFMRNRPVFIVLSQVEEERDSAAGEYRF